MQLREYLFRNRITGTEFAKMIDVSQQYLSKLTTSKLICGRSLALKIEAVTNGIVTAKEMLFPEETQDKGI